MRKLSASASELEITRAEKLNEIRLLEEKIQYFKRELEKNKEEFMYVAEELIQCKEDKKVMEKYYDERWNTEINSLKMKLEKKHTNKVSSLEQEYEAMKEDLNL